MKVVILCGGKGTRLSEETITIPKPMVKIGDKPIIWHLMKIFSYFGFDEFILATGYKKEVIENFFTDNQDFKKIETIDTGQETLTGGRLLRLKEKLSEEKTFLMTYGDGLCDINIQNLVDFHKNHKKIATLTAVHPPVRFGELKLQEDKIVDFQEKPQANAGWVNGGFFVLNNEILNYIDNDQTIFEREPMTKLSKSGELMAYKHEKFWQCMDTMRDKILLNKMWNNKKAPWKK
jgi:glucose-1-phosphate cytidylyltransferase